MKQSYLFYIVFFLISCTQKRKCDLSYRGLTDQYCVSGKLENGRENGRFIFTRDGKQDLFEEAGFYSEGIRNDLWGYRIKEKLIEVKWGGYEDKVLHFNTNLFSEIDSVKRGDNFTKFKIKSDQGQILLTVSINDSLKNLEPERNYQEIVKSEFKKMGYDVVSSNNKSTSDQRHKIYFNDMVVKEIGGEGDSIFLKNAFGWIGRNFVDFTVSYTDQKNDKAAILFEGVFTNFYLDKQRLFDPFN